MSGTSTGVPGQGTLPPSAPHKAAEGAVSPRSTIAGRRSRRSQALVGWLFSAPGLILLAIFIVVPFGLAVYFSFTNERLISPLPTRFVGLDNYVATLTSGTFWRSFLNNTIFVIVVVPLQTVFALSLAVMVNSRIRGRVVFRTIYFLPVVTVMAAASVVWILLFNPEGLINAVMKIVTFGAFSPDWLNDPFWALPAVMIVSIWQGVGFQMIILLAALQDVPEELYEAAALDGAGRWAQFRNVTVPGIRNGLIFVITVTAIFAFKLFDQVYIMPQTPGGPLDSTRTMMLEIVETGYGAQQIGKASAIAVIFFVIVLGVTLIQRVFIKEEGEVR